MINYYYGAQTAAKEIICWACSSPKALLNASLWAQRRMYLTKFGRLTSQAERCWRRVARSWDTNPPPRPPRKMYCPLANRYWIEYFPAHPSRDLPKYVTNNLIKQTMDISTELETNVNLVQHRATHAFTETKVIQFTIGPNYPLGILCSLNGGDVSAVRIR